MGAYQELYEEFKNGALEFLHVERIDKIEEFIMFTLWFIVLISGVLLLFVCCIIILILRVVKRIIKKIMGL